jgi:hypothetical protein
MSDEGVAVQQRWLARRTVTILMVTGLLLAACVLAGVVALRARSHDGYIAAVLVHGLGYALAVAAILAGGRRFDSRRVLWLILATAVALRVIAFAVPVGITTDAYRYVWDGRLQAGGVNPYLTVPADPRLQRFREEAIYPNLNGPDIYPTIYPPTAQIAFLLATRLIDGIDGIKLLMAAAEIAIMAALLAWLRTLQLPLNRVLIYAWHPLPLWEFTAHGHIDALVALFVTLGMLAAARGRAGWTGAAFAAAALVKYWPAYLAAAVWRRWDWRPLVAALATIVLLYVPYVAPWLYGFGFDAVPVPKVVGSLFKHLDAEGYNEEGWGFFLAYAPKHFGWFDIGGQRYARLAALALLALGAWVALRHKPASEPPDPRLAMLLITAFLLLISPHYPWYYALAVPLLVAAPYPATLYVTLAVPLLYVEIDYVWLVPYPRFKAYMIIYGGFLVLAAWHLWRHLRWRRRIAAGHAGVHRAADGRNSSR